MQAFVTPYALLSAVFVAIVAAARQALLPQRLKAALASLRRAAVALRGAQLGHGVGVDARGVADVVAVAAEHPRRRRRDEGGGQDDQRGEDGSGGGGRLRGISCAGSHMLLCVKLAKLEEDR
uniref:Uncharacterized protein n=1 Tax=Oryza meridionalis TaxID=40149 RepID=A0A0E0FBX6_9ORYZ